VSIDFVTAIFTLKELGLLIHNPLSGLQSLFTGFDFCRCINKLASHK
jgi:hypothetical protein